MKECQLLPPIVQYFFSKGFMAYAEVPLNNRWIDLYLVNRNSEETIAIELKVTNWKRAFNQAKVYPLVADHVYVGMPDIYIHRAINNKTYFESAGIGLISVNGIAEIILAPKKSRIVSSKIKNKVLNCLADEKEVRLDVNNKPTKPFYPDIFGFRAFEGG